MSNSQFISYGPDCVSWMTDTDQCKAYYLGYQLQPDDSCCSEIVYIATESYCLCDSTAINNSFPFDVKKALTLPSICGVTSPCDKVLFVNGSLKLDDQDNLVPRPRSELGPSYAPSSPLEQPTSSPAGASNANSSGLLIVYPYSISVAILFINILFLYFP
ncbi:hypothetical protein TSUD_376830 [Trifolium subterraneum]|uniref:Bifunctional inhibitor/plant lipid transfer protein/seed storage helical domain-containing protein n=1 Tax=Trifolium subterraneum TaxID=3900 RepID=A0A2Z6MBH1_TRISU|nr:hypothetical protein TSUD_376830 [Trifolium subterraneum]